MPLTTPYLQFPSKYLTVCGTLMTITALFTAVYSCFDVKVMNLFIGTLICSTLVTILGVLIMFTGCNSIQYLVNNANVLLGLTLLSDILTIIAFCIFCNMAEYFGTYNDVVNNSIKKDLYLTIDTHFILSLVSVVLLLLSFILQTYLLHVINSYWRLTASYQSSQLADEYPSKFLIFSGISASLIGLFTFILSCLYSHGMFIATLIFCLMLTVLGVAITLAGLKIWKYLVEQANVLMCLAITADICSIIAFSMFCYLTNDFANKADHSDEFIHRHFVFCLIAVLMLLYVIILLTILTFAVNRYKKIAAVSHQRTPTGAADNPSFWM
ncbi:hypothetical protein Ahia01_000805500 [Argonauta hians]